METKSSYGLPETLLPHGGQMVLLDEITYCDEHKLTARLCLREGHPLQQPDGRVPAWMGLELLAQCVGAWDGYHARACGEAVRLGFLLGTRRLAMPVPYLPLHVPLRAEAVLSVRDQSGFAVFDGSLWQESGSGDVLLLQAALNVFSPPDAAAYLAQQGES